MVGADHDNPRRAEPRLPHAALDLGSRRAKALKIERLLDLPPGPLRLLEVGTGSGGIAHHFAVHPSGRFSVEAVDVVDARQVSEGYRFTQVADTALPFGDAQFDVVISNHVIEHVGDRSEQLRHLCELRRVLRPGGVGYFAVPNRWMLVEPHFHLPFLSWLPRRWRDGYVRLAGRGTRYDCDPKSLGEIEALFREAKLHASNLCVRALRETLAIERPGSLLRKLFDRIPDRTLDRFRHWIPTLIFRITR
jgi:SAM-dependent methyltransferase